MAIVFFSSRRRHTRYWRDWSSDVCSSDLIIHQELSVLPNLTVAENIFLGNEKYSKFTRKINKTLIRERSKMFLEQIGCKVNPDYLVDRKSTRLNSSHANISYAVFCLKKKKI